MENLESIQTRLRKPLVIEGLEYGEIESVRQSAFSICALALEEANSYKDNTRNMYCTQIQEVLHFFSLINLHESAEILDELNEPKKKAIEEFITSKGEFSVMLEKPLDPENHKTKISIKNTTVK